MGYNITELQEGQTKEGLVKTVTEFLTLPKRAEIENKNGELPKDLGNFLIETGDIKDVVIDNETWEFKYNCQEKTISISQEEMPANIWRDFVFRKQTTLKSGASESLFPMHPMYNGNSQKNDLEIYRFLQQTVNAYQGYLKNKESSVSTQQHSPYSNLFTFCYSKRKTIAEKISVVRGLSTWGSIQNDENIQNQSIRALKDVNELITIYLWNPQYFDSYIDYLNTNQTLQLYKKHLVKIDDYEAKYIKENTVMLITDMKKDINNYDKMSL